jgi:DNA-binding transcriptional MerR regulator
MPRPPMPDAHNQTRVLSTNAVTKQLGVTARTVRFYSEIGIVTPIRRGTTRLFTPDQVRRLKLARDLRSLGMDIKTVMQVLDTLQTSASRLRKTACAHRTVLRTFQGVAEAGRGNPPAILCNVKAGRKPVQPVQAGLSAAVHHRTTRLPGQPTSPVMTGADQA